MINKESKDLDSMRIDVFSFMICKKIGSPRYPFPQVSTVFIWCRRSESNRHDCKSRGILSPLRLPVSPLRHGADYYDGVPKCQEKCIDIDRKRVLDAHLFSESRTCGVVAQLGERLNGIQEAASSILASSTMNTEGLSASSTLFCTTG